MEMDLIEGITPKSRFLIRLLGPIFIWLESNGISGMTIGLVIYLFFFRYYMSILKEKEGNLTSAEKVIKFFLIFNLYVIIVSTFFLQVQIFVNNGKSIIK